MPYLTKKNPYQPPPACRQLWTNLVGAQDSAQADPRMHFGSEPGIEQCWPPATKVHAWNHKRFCNPDACRYQPMPLKALAEGAGRVGKTPQAID